MFCDRCASPRRGKEGGHAVRFDRAQPRISQGRNQIVPPVAGLEKLLTICSGALLAGYDFASLLENQATLWTPLQLESCVIL